MALIRAPVEERGDPQERGLDFQVLPSRVLPGPTDFCKQIYSLRSGPRLLES